MRRARFGNGWVKTTGGDWSPLNRAWFTALGADGKTRPINAGLEDGRFLLATGGDTKTSLRAVGAQAAARRPAAARSTDQP